ncbi:GNAT family N-acetyltransferase [Streptomyces globosus]|uniref:GNAT family N-acetyltransferase n=1 Tax=Streptomyces globosus TaxID=68209 RepID=A0A344TXW5_9ACTN|nr:GNAT family N-acetyltransferase [Streptomyces globosus]AXE23486.1 GNAT family N-acetyltransferase [Streptomyces globosus]
MTWTFTHDLAAYRAAAGAAVAADPVANTLLLTVEGALRRRGPHAFSDRDPVFGWWTGADGAVAGGFLCTPPYPLVLGRVPGEAVAALGEALRREPVLSGIGGFNARLADGERLAEAWGRPLGEPEVLRLYRLGELAAPEPAPRGRARAAAEADLPLVREWCASFAAEVGDPPPGEGAVRDRVAGGGMLLWEDAAGRPAGLAAFSPPDGGASRIGPVYTPPAHRRRGYAAGATHAAVGAARAAGAREVLLFADTANPTSTGVYLRLGFLPVEDRAVVVAR